MQKIRPTISARTKAIAALVALSPWLAYGQANPTPTSASTPPAEEEEILVLSPFEVQADDNTDGYVTSTTLAGNRLATNLRDLGTSLSVYNSQFMKDIGATDQRTLLQYTLGTEVSGILGNYSGSGGGISPDTGAAYRNPQSENRVRGLVGADNSRDLFITNIPWDGYNIEAADIQRGPNAMLFGQGSPGGVINTRTKQASYRDSAEVSVRVDQYGSLRGSLDVNRVLLKDELAIRFAALQNEAKFQQEPAFENSNRQFLALRFEPKFLKKGDARTIIKLNGELGSSTSNRPRNMPPRDRLTPWFTIGTPTYNLGWLKDNNWQNPGRGDATRQNNANVANPNFEPLLGGNGTGFPGGGPLVQYEAGSPNPVAAIRVDPNVELGIGSNGAIDRGIFLPASGPVGMPGYRQYAAELRLPFFTLAKDKFITDPSIFDFYNNLIDGGIKREWYDFKTFDASLSQTFFNDQVGFDLGYHEETYKDGGYAPVDDTLQIDVHSQWSDGTNSPAGWNQDATHNFGAGRPFLGIGNREGSSQTDRESLRATAFATHDFAKDGSAHWLLRALGQHTITGMASRDDSLRYEKSWWKSTIIGDYYNHPMFAELRRSSTRFHSEFWPQQIMYIGPNLQGKTLGQDLGIRASSVAPQVGDKMTLRYFDPTWKATGVDPAAPWTVYKDVGTPGGGTFQSTQSENPENYVGWGNREVSLMTDSSEANREYLMQDRKWDDRYNKTKAIVWQGKFWDDSIVATAGLRWDTVGQTVTRWDRTPTTADPLQIANQVTVNGPYEDKKSKSYGVVAHFDGLPFIGKWAKRLPVSISATYNRSENFQTGQVYNDYFGQQLPLPKGETKDMGVIVATRDGKYSARLNKFESAVKNNFSQGLEFWNYGNNVGVFARRYHQLKYNYEQEGNPNSVRHGNNIISDLPPPTNGAPNRKYDFDFAPVFINGQQQTQADAEAQEIATINAWDQWLVDMAPLPQTMAEAFNFNWDGSDLDVRDNDFRFSEDMIAKGYELELQAQITDSWRLTLNASRIKSYRDNIGGSPAPANNVGIKTMMDYLLDFDRRLNTTAMGDLRMWGFAGNATVKENWNGYADGDLKARLAEQGTVVPENRLWHINVISNYDFKEGRLKGWNVGAAARYESALTLGYKPVKLPGADNAVGYDLNSPYKDDALLDFDLWVGYNRKINDKIHWRAQLNVQNVGVGNELLPVTVQPDGSVAAWRIRPSQQISLTNTFSF
jgi:outer membrane receptor protein involved in Fe transport